MSRPTLDRALFSALVDVACDAGPGLDHHDVLALTAAGMILARSPEVAHGWLDALAEHATAEPTTAPDVFVDRLGRNWRWGGRLGVWMREVAGPNDCTEFLPFELLVARYGPVPEPPVEQTPPAPAERIPGPHEYVGRPDRRCEVTGCRMTERHAIHPHEFAGDDITDCRRWGCGLPLTHPSGVHTNRSAVPDPFPSSRGGE